MSYNVCRQRMITKREKDVCLMQMSRSSCRNAGHAGHCFSFTGTILSWAQNTLDVVAIYELTIFTILTLARQHL